MNYIFKQALVWGLCATVLAAQAADPKPSASTVRPATGAALLQLDDGRAGRGNLIATTGIRGFGKPAQGAAHALIMTIGDYPGPIPKLSGVVHDAATASDIARRMGVPPANIRVLRDGELTLDGMRRAFDDLEARLGGDDQVFIYYSGHGGRQLVTEAGGERCAESLIAADGQGLVDIEVEARLSRIAQKTQKTIVFLDACHSGGVTTRSTGVGKALFTPKSWTPPEQSCVRPTNVLTRSIARPRPPGDGGANFVHIAAARDSEISLDQPGRGGVATQAWQACLAGAARDLDGSGGLSADEIRTCAQQRINDQLKNAQGFLPHHVSVTGNAATVLSYAIKNETPATPAPAAAVPVAALPVVPDKVSPLAALRDIYNSRDDRRLTTLAADKTTLKIGQDELHFTLTSREGGYAYLLMVGSDGKTFDLLFPNKIDRQNVIEAGGSLRLPRPSWQLTASGPPGQNTLLAIVADNPRDFGSAGLKPAGPFSVIDAMAAKDIQLVTVGATRPADGECTETSTRTLAIRQRCATGYGAAMLTIEEVR